MASITGSMHGQLGLPSRHFSDTASASHSLGCINKVLFLFQNIILMFLQVLVARTCNNLIMYIGVHFIRCVTLSVQDAFIEG